MTRTAEWSVIRGKDERAFTVHYTEDIPERTEAVEFFRVHGGSLYPICPVTDTHWAMYVTDANAYFAANPIPQLYDSLYLRQAANITDEDLIRLACIPELTRLHITTGQISDIGVRHIVSSLPDLKALLVYSPLITDECLEAIARVKNLEVLDLQSSLQITGKAFEVLLERLPKIVDSYGPHS